MGASLRYLSQRFTAPNRICMGVLNDVGTEELAHLEMVSKIVHQLTANMTMEEIECSGFAPYYVDHTAGVWSQAAGGVADPIRFLRAREVVHYQRFGEALQSVLDQLDEKNFFAFNPSFDNPCKASCDSCR